MAPDLLASSRPGEPPPVLMIEVLKLIDAVRQLREVQGRAAQATAASRAAAALAASVNEQQRDVAALAIVPRPPHARAGTPVSMPARVVPPPAPGQTFRL